MLGTRAISTTSRRKLSSSFFLQGKAPKEIHAILAETLACFLPGWAKDLSAPLYRNRTGPRRPRGMFVWISCSDRFWDPPDLLQYGDCDYFMRRRSGRSVRLTCHFRLLPLHGAWPSPFYASP